jgi:hypothetical protein
MTCRMSTTRLRSESLRAAAFALTAAALLAGCSGPTNEGPTRTEAREVGEFHSVNIRGAANASIKVGAATSLRVTADQESLQALHTTVRNGMLLVEQKRGWFWNHGRVELQMTVPALQEVVISGAGDIVIDGARGSHLELSLQGAGNLTANGDVDLLTVTINGAGDAALAGLRARSAKVVVNGTGDVTVHATEALDALVNGVGSVRYIGTPASLATKVNGVGAITQTTPPGT